MENMYLVGIVPGPKQPSLTQWNHFVRPLVDQLDVFYNHGFFLTQTPQYSNGCTARGALIPIIADLHAAWQLTAFGAFIQDIEEVDPMKWPRARTCDEHRRYAMAWLNAESTEKWSEFLHLSYWDPTRYLVFDSMHGWFLNDFENHVRTMVGVS
ncbi:hypothetical protein K439DRAFT_1649673 [Ramaria rubella]|nr:hypothetical protein K439DRAFT_1649673 [Ramaria rubella]